MYARTRGTLTPSETIRIRIAHVARTVRASTCRGRLACVACLRARVAPARRVRASRYRPRVLCMSERMQPENSDFRSSFSGCVPFSVLVTFTARGSLSDPVHRTAVPQALNKWTFFMHEAELPAARNSP